MRDFADRDLEHMSEKGIQPERVSEQMALFRDPPPFTCIVRACTVGDGIVRLDETGHEALIAYHDEAARAGRISKFVPASGAATRMFKALLAHLDSENDGLEEATTFLAELDRFPFSEALKDVAGPSAGRRELLRALLLESGLGYASLPKGLLAFHRCDEAARTPFEEHLVEAAEYARDAEGCCRLHFTVSPQHEAGFRDVLETQGKRLASALGVRFEVTFSHQDPATDTLAVDMDNRPFRDERSRLVFRPGGHGALLSNLEASGGDIVLIKNIDNVSSESRARTTARWKKILSGFLIETQKRCFALLEALHSSEVSAESLSAAEILITQALGLELPEGFDARTTAEQVAWYIERLDRPLRVCGMVRNDGEPGGGPFWVRDAKGTVSCQIVEGSQVDTSSAACREIVAGATHFNPVDLACGLRDWRGRPFVLQHFVDPSTVFISEKSVGGRELKALELPGLWNGAMAGWNTIFLELPLATFTPVKTVFDLLRPEHQ